MNFAVDVLLPVALEHLNAPFDRPNVGGRAGETMADVDAQALELAVGVVARERTVDDLGGGLLVASGDRVGCQGLSRVVSGYVSPRSTADSNSPIIALVSM